ncbi:MAG TPA: hypothetical protein VLE99_03200 [Candidatus Saccharimonadales bacterium]|nr:hypothetical protein [Candidatus Saccharimonadales bacterium]
MHQSQYSVQDHPSAFFSTILRQAGSLVTTKRLVYLLVTTALVVATASLAYKSSPAHAPATSETSTLTLQNTNGTQPKQSSLSATSTDSVPASSNANAPSSANLTVNGQPVTVPSSGTTHETIVNSDGSHTTVTTSGSNTGTATNNYSSHINISVQSSSSSKSGGSSP